VASAYLEDVLILCRLRQRTLRDFARYLEELPGMRVAFPGQHNGQSVVASMADFRVKLD
jgi:hypothetical protein